ncbi:MAG: DNA polymerase III subunit delta [Peptococcaceae bacterium]|nr:DNA polymerase III subunit delta [Peptococcaceae bacterium]
MSVLQILQKKVAAGEIAPVQLWYGEDRYSMREGVRLLKHRFLEADPSGSSIEVFSGKGALKFEEIVVAAQTPSFFSGRLVVVDSLVLGKAGEGSSGGSSGGGSGGSKGDNNEAGLGQLIEYCRKPNPQNCLVLMAEKVNRTRKLYKVIAKEGQVVDFSFPQNFRDWQGWVQEEAARWGKKISPAAAGFLVEWSGRHVGILSQEIQKCGVFIGDRQEIKRADIECLCVPRVEASIFVLLDAIAGRRVQEGLSCLRDVLRHEYYMRVHAMIVRHIRLLLAGCMVSRTQGSGGSGGSARDFLMEAAGIRSPYEAGKILTQAGRFESERLVRFLEMCLDTEIKIKTGGGEAHFLLEIMVVEFCR